MRPAEAAAQALVTEILSTEDGVPVALELHDVPPLQGVHDFWVHRASGREALEVTTLADQGAVNNKMHWRTRGPASEQQVEGLAHGWSVMVDDAAKATGVKKHLAAWLLALEAEEITAGGRWDHRVYEHPVIFELARAGVLTAEAVPFLPAGLVKLSYAAMTLPGRPMNGAEHVAQALTEALQLKRHQGDANKLARSGAAVRHLYLAVDLNSRFDVVRAASEGLPTEAPVVSDQITWVWLAIPAEGATDVLRWSASTGWLRNRVER
nr:hypothetical protein KPHV_87560 [Kitasatospora purpeofusca]